MLLNSNNMQGDNYNHEATKEVAQILILRLHRVETGNLLARVRSCQFLRFLKSFIAQESHCERPC